MGALRLTMLVAMLVSVAGANSPPLAGIEQGESKGRPAAPQGETWASIARLPDWSGAWIVPFGAFREEITRIRDPKSPDAPAWMPAYATLTEHQRLRVQTGREATPGVAARQNS